jgi:hypothetical protein
MEISEMPKKDNRINPDNQIVLLILDKENKMNWKSLTTIIDFCHTINKNLSIVSTANTGISASRNFLFNKLSETFIKNPIGFMIDSDIEIENSKEFIQKLKYVYENKINVFAPYSFINENEEKISIAKKYEIIENKVNIDLFKTKKEFLELKEYTDIYPIGLGFYFGEIPMQYKFQDYGFLGEDILFWLTNKIKLNPKLLKLDLIHKKMINLSLYKNNEFLKIWGDKK